MDWHSPEKPRREASWRQRLSLRYRELGRLLRLHVDLTSACALRCPHCYQQGRFGRGPELDAARWQELLAEAADLGVLFLLVSGGDPMLRPDFRAFVQAARARHFHVRIKTTGLCLEPHDAAWMSALGNLDVDLSLHGAKPATHDRFVGSTGAFESTLAAARALVTVGVPVSFATTMTAANADEMTEVLALGRREGVPVRISGSLTHQLDGRLPDVSPAGIEDQARILALSHTPDTLDPPKLAPGDPLCLAAHDGLYIDPTGDVFPCVAWPRCLGSVSAHPLAEVFAGPEAAAVRRFRQSDRAACRDCHLQDSCSFCPGEAELAHGNCLTPASSSCDQARVAARAVMIARQDGGENDD